MVPKGEDAVNDDQIKAIVLGQERPWSAMDPAELHALVTECLKRGEAITQLREMLGDVTEQMERYLGDWCKCDDAKCVCGYDAGFVLIEKSLAALAAAGNASVSGAN